MGTLWFRAAVAQLCLEVYDVNLHYNPQVTSSTIVVTICYDC